MFTIETEFNELKNHKILEPILPFLLSNGESMVFKKGYTFLDMQKDHPTWNAEEAVWGLNRLLELREKGEQVLYDLGSKKGRVLYFPADKRKETIPVVLVSGGGYYCVGNLTESIPVAARLNELGYDAFCINYQTGGMGVLPQAMKDLAEGIRFALGRAYQGSAENRKYILSGFSAGGHLAGMWATDYGYARCDLPAPEAMWLNYPLVNGYIDACAGKFSAWMMRRMMFGMTAGKETCMEWSLDRHINETYPQTFLTMAKDDDMIPQEQYRSLLDALENSHVPYQLIQIEKGGHGYGLGEHTEAKGWVEEAANWTRTNRMD